MDKKMTSGEIAKKAGVSLKAVRLYDEKGLLKPTDYSEGNYRLYDKEALVVLEKIVALKQIGFSLDEIRNNLEEGKSQDIRGVLEQQLQVMEEKQYRIQQVIAMIRGTLESRQGELDWDTIAEMIQNITLDQKADERHWDALQHTASEMDWYVKIFQSLKLKEKETILDLGCGFAKLWRNNWSVIPQNTQIHGYDLHGTWADDFDTYIHEHEGELPEGVKVTLHFEDVEAVDTWDKMKKNQYSCIIAHYIYDMIKHSDTFFERICGALQEGGKFSVNGGTVDTWNSFFQEMLQDLGLRSDFVDKRIAGQRQKRDVFINTLKKYFSKMESVELTSCWHYTEAEDLYQKLIRIYPQEIKYLSYHEEEIKNYFHEKISLHGELVVETTSQFWHCYK